MNARKGWGGGGGMEGKERGYVGESVIVLGGGMGGGGGVTGGGRWASG